MLGVGASFDGPFAALEAVSDVSFPIVSAPGVIF